MFEHLLAAPFARRESRKILEMGLEVEGLKLPAAREVTATGVGLPLYVHIPFCKSLCPFCSFNRYLFKEDHARAYYASLWEELELYLDAGYKFTSMHVGGGTPTSHLESLLEFLDKARGALGIRYVDVESTPNEINDDSVRSLKDAGVRRLSLGVQSFDSGMLRRMGRVGYDGTSVLDKISIAAGNFQTLAIDLIFNFPGQTEESFARDLHTLKSSGAGQVTLYPLMPGPHKSTSIERAFNMRSLRNLRLSTMEKRFYGMVGRELMDDGWHANSVWSFSRDGEHLDEYVIDNDEYVGIGSSSVSFIGNTVRINSFSLKKYAGYVSKGMAPAVGTMRLNRNDVLQYKLLSALFSMHVPLGEWTGGGSGIRKYLRLLKMFGVVKAADGELLVTRKGMYYVSVLMREFLSALNGLRELCIEKKI